MNQLIYDGKAKSIYSIDGKVDEVLQVFKDTITAFNNPKPYIFEGKGVVSCQISSYIFKFLERNGIKTHLISCNDSESQVVQKLDILKIEITIRNYAFGNVLKRSHFTKGEKLREPLLEFMYKEDKFGDPVISEDYVLKYLLDNNEELFREAKKLSFKINELLNKFFEAIDITLSDFKVEVGLNKKGELLLADEISGDTCRLRDNLNNLLPLDKDLLREDIGNVLNGYKEILRRIKAKYTDL